MSDSPKGSRTLLPRLAYQDTEAAGTFLCDAFGFVEDARFPPSGPIAYAEFSLNGETVLALGTASEEVASPQTSGCNTVSLMCYVPDVDSHYRQAEAAGATLLGEPRDTPWGDRSYNALDLEGHHWVFRQSVKDVPLDELARSLGTK